jgi:multidrug efflux pump subunit AcrA (membrane-fusion protein)
MNVKSIMQLAAIAAATLACAEPPAAVVGGLPPVGETATVIRGEFRDVLYLTGEVESGSGEMIVVPRIPNWQTSIKTLVKDGTRVEAGDLVAELDSTQFSSGLEQRRQGLTDAVQSIAQQAARNEAELTQKKFDLKQKHVTLEKARTTARIPREILPLRTWEENQLALRRAESEYEKASTDLEAQKKAGDAELENLRLNQAGAVREIRISEAAIAALTLRAETSGVVVIGENGNTGRKFQSGDTVWVGMRLAMIPDLSGLRVTATMIDVDDGRVEPGMPVEIVVDAFPETTFRGRVSEIGTVADTLGRDSLRRGFALTIELEEADRALLRPGYSIRAAIITSRVPDALLVPRATVDLSGDAPVVRRKNGSVIEGATIGACSAQSCLVVSGLEEGDRVATGGGTRS